MGIPDDELVTVREATNAAGYGDNDPVSSQVTQTSSTDQTGRAKKSKATPPDGDLTKGSKMPQIRSREDLQAAIEAAGSDPRRKVRDALVRQARALGATDLCPPEWLEGVQESARPLREATKTRSGAKRAKRTRKRGLAGTMGLDDEVFRTPSGRSRADQ